MTHSLKQPIAYPSVYFGCDPEFFFASKDGHIVGAEKVLPKGGKLDRYVLDGVQVELNPAADPCRANLANAMKSSFRKLKEHLKATPELKANFSSVVNIDPAELASLSEQARVFGCAPSLNSHDAGAAITVNAGTYLKRSAGGHIHLGFSHGQAESKGIETYNSRLMKNREQLVPLLDVLVGNTSVMIDRDPEAATRRLHYGRAGEYRLPKHGLEYRVLSNFWLQSYQLMSLVMGLSRMAVGVLSKSLGPNMAKPILPKDYPYYTQEKWDELYPPANYEQWDAASDLLGRVNIANVREAINTNNLELAQENYKGVREFIREHVPSDWQAMGLCPVTLDAFDFFCEKVQTEGMQYWFPTDPLEHWCNIPEGHGTGWEAYLATTVKAKMKKEQDAAKASEALNLVYTVAMPEVLVPPEVIRQAFERDAKGRFAKKYYDVAGDPTIDEIPF